MNHGLDKGRVRAKKPQPEDKFVRVKKLGTIKAPEDYDLRTQIARFIKKHKESFVSINSAVTDENYQPTRIIRAGDEFDVTLFRTAVGSGGSTPEERLDFHQKQNAVLLGIQGLTLVFDQLLDKLPRGKRCVSLDTDEHLFEIATDMPAVPILFLGKNKRPHVLDIEITNIVWPDYFYFVVFTSVQM